MNMIFADIVMVVAIVFTGSHKCLLHTCTFTVEPPQRATSLLLSLLDGQSIKLNLIYSALSLRRTPSGPAVTVHLR